MSAQNKSGKKVTMGIAAYIAGLAAVPVLLAVNTFAGLVVLSLPVALVFMAS